MSHQAYGPKVGVPRILKLLGAQGQAGDLLLPGPHRRALAARSRAGARGRARDRAARLHAQVAGVQHTPGAARRDRARAGRARQVRRDAGRLPRADVVDLEDARWRRSAGYGIRYDSSMFDDDRPYLLDTPSGRVAELPIHWCWTTGSSTSTCRTPTSATSSTGPASSPSSGSRSSMRCARPTRWRAHLSPVRQRPAVAPPRHRALHRVRGGLRRRHLLARGPAGRRRARRGGHQRAREP